MKKLFILLVTLVILLVGWVFYLSSNSFKISVNSEGNGGSKNSVSDLVTGEEEEIAEDDGKNDIINEGGEIIGDFEDEEIVDFDELPDLKFGSFSRGGGGSGGSGGGAPVYQMIILNFNVVNAGILDISQKFKVSFYDVTNTENEFLIEEKEIEFLVVDGEYSVYFSSEGDENYGQSVIKIILDSGEEIDELDEENNLAISYPTRTDIYPLVTSSSSGGG